jgi:hypothetical protein
MLADTARRRLHERALDRYGYVTTRDCEEVGVAPVELRKIKQRGGVEHIAYGIYRFDDIPRTGKEELIEAVLRVGDDAYLTHDSVLALHDLALVEPSPCSGRDTASGSPKTSAVRRGDASGSRTRRSHRVRRNSVDDSCTRAYGLPQNSHDRAAD